MYKKYTFTHNINLYRLIICNNYVNNDIYSPLNQHVRASNVSGNILFNTLGLINIYDNIDDIENDRIFLSKK